MSFEGYKLFSFQISLADAGIGALKPFVPDWQVKEVDEVKQLERFVKLKNFTDTNGMHTLMYD